MAYFGSITEIPDGDLTYKNNCINGKCSNCGECCTDLLPLSTEEVRRQKALMMHGCNYITEGTKRSAPFAIFNRQDVLQLALELGVHVPEIYGEIVRDPDGTLRTTGAQRTGCSMCGFGIHLEKRPHRFDRLWKSNSKEWEFWMKNADKLPDGTPYGWGHILDYIGVGWADPWEYFPDTQSQLSLFQNL